MNRKEFMERLEKLLWNIPDSEREEALLYYNDYFDDAGVENEARIIEELVSPEQVAQKLKAGLDDSAAEYTEQGYTDTRFQNNQEVAARDVHAVNEKKTNVWKIVAIVLLCMLLLPVALPVCAALLIAAVSVIIGLVAVAIGIVAAGFAVLLCGVVVIGVGITQIFAAPPVGVALTGVGCLIFAVGILLSMAVIWCCTKIIPWLIRGIVGLISYPFRKAGARR